MIVVAVKRFFGGLLSLNAHQRLFLVAITLGFSIYKLFVPIDIVSSNADNFETSFIERIGASVVAVVAVAIAAWIVVRIIPSKLASVLAPISAAAALYLWGYGLLISAASGVLGGEPGMVVVTNPFGSWELPILAGGIPLTAYLGWRWPFVLTRIFTIALVLLTVGAITQTLRAHQKPLPNEGTPELAFKFSPKENVLVILLDALQSDIFKDALDALPELRSELSGFIFFRNAVAPSTSTYLSLPAIHSGEVSDGRNLDKFFRRSIQDESFLRDLAKAGYQAVDGFPVKNVCPLGVVFCGSLDPGGTRKQQYRVVYGLRDFRLLPFALKKSPEGIGNRPTAVSGFRLGRFAENISVASDNPPAAKLIHILTTHPPFALTDTCNLANEISVDRAPAVAQTICSLRDFHLLLTRMKEIGVYDKTLIIVTGDHGLGTPSAYAKQSLLDKGIDPSALEKISNSNSSVFDRANPVLLVKPQDSSGMFREDENLVSISQIRGTICGLTGKCSAQLERSLFSEPAQAPSFSFLGYEWTKMSWADDNITNGRSFSITGPPWNIDSWTPQSAAKVQFGERYPFALTGLFASKDNPAWSNYGWSHPDTSGMWSRNARAALWLDLPDGVSEGFELKIAATAYTSSDNKFQDVDVLLNGKWIDHYSFKEGDADLTLISVVPPGTVTGGKARLDFLIQEPRSPRSTGLSDDPRWLGIILRNIGIDRVKPSAQYRLNDTLSLSDPATRRFSNRGWAAPEGWGSWIAGSQALIVLPLVEAPRKDLVLRATVQAFLDDTHPELNAEVLINGTRLARRTFERAAPLQNMELRVPAALLQEGRAVVEFRGRPKGMLGLGVREVRLSDE